MLNGAQKAFAPLGCAPIQSLFSLICQPNNKSDIQDLHNVKYTVLKHA
jgi:hypothetical protein